jgi:hypothetical protein
MSDSDCSNCDDMECEYRIDDHFNCYKIKLNTLKKAITKKDIAYLLDLSERIKKAEEEEGICIYVPDLIEDIILDFNEALKRSNYGK